MEEVFVSTRQKWAICIILVAIAVAPFAQTLNFDFVNFDDNLYVTENRVVQAGLTWSGIRYALTTFEGGNWHPLTWLSHMLDCTLFGMDAGKHHAVNVLIHAANTVLLALLLWRMTNAWWRSTLVAALFAVHPMHVESVAWIAERKDVMAAFWGFLALHCYVTFVVGSQFKWYALMTVCFVASLMFKPMLVTLPALLLLLDGWPLRRWLLASQWLQESEGDHETTIIKPVSLLSLLVEKVPLLLISLVFSVVAVISQRSSEAMTTFDHLGLTARLANSVVAYDEYLRKLVLPIDLAVFYPHPLQWSTQRVLLGVATIVVITTVAVWRMRRDPWLLTGWLWFLGLLIPVIGLVQVGMQFMADRYTYLPAIGVFIMFSWSLSTLTTRLPRVLLGGFAALTVLVFAVITFRQVGYWQDSRSLFTRAQAVTRNNYMAHQNLGNALERDGELDAAMVQYLRAAEIKPHLGRIHENVANVLMRQGRFDQAMNRINHALSIKPDSATGNNSLGVILMATGRVPEAEVPLRRSVELDPDNIEARGNLGAVLLRLGKFDEAVGNLTIVAKAAPSRYGIRVNLAMALHGAGRTGEAIAELEQILRESPTNALATGALTQLRKSISQPGG